MVKKGRAEEFLALVTGLLDGFWGPGAMDSIAKGSAEGKSTDEIFDDLRKLKNEK